MTVRQPVGVKGDVLRFITQHERADLLEDGVARPAIKEPVVGGADNFGDDEDLNLEVQAESAAGLTEDEVRPMAPDERAAEAMDETLEQTRVFLLLVDEEREGLGVAAVGAGPGARLLEEEIPV